MNRNTSIALLLVLASLASVKALDLADGVVVGSALIRALNEGRSPYERRNIARTFVGRLAAATWAPRAGGF